MRRGRKMPKKLPEEHDLKEAALLGERIFSLGMTITEEGATTDNAATEALGHAVSAVGAVAMRGNFNAQLLLLTHIGEAMSTMAGDNAHLEGFKSFKDKLLKKHNEGPNDITA
jgi:hypothetical protein